MISASHLLCPSPPSAAFHTQVCIQLWNLSERRIWILVGFGHVIPDRILRPLVLPSVSPHGNCTTYGDLKKKKNGRNDFCHSSWSAQLEPLWFTSPSHRHTLKRQAGFRGNGRASALQLSWTRSILHQLPAPFWRTKRLLNIQFTLRIPLYLTTARSWTRFLTPTSKFH